MMSVQSLARMVAFWGNFSVEIQPDGELCVFSCVDLSEAMGFQLVPYALLKQYHWVARWMSKLLRRSWNTVRRETPVTRRAATHMVFLWTQVVGFVGTTLNVLDVRRLNHFTFQMASPFV